MTFGKLVLGALSKGLGSQEEAIERAGEILRIKGKVLPVTMEKIDLVAKYDDGRVVIGEHLIDEPEHDGRLRLTQLTTQPKGRCFTSAEKAIEGADMIVFWPGDMYTSTLAPVVVDDVAKVISQSKAKLVYVVNLMTKYGQTYGFKASDHVAEMEKYVGRKMDAVIINNSVLPAEAIKKYEIEQAVPVEDDLGEDSRVVRADVLQPVEVAKQDGDTLKRSLLRHDPEKLARIIDKV